MTIGFSKACENNKAAILSILKSTFKPASKILEIGSGTGQHAVYFAENMPKLTWLTSDLLINHPSISARVNYSRLDNIKQPIILDLNEHWPTTHLDEIDGVFTANTLHIVSWPLVMRFFEQMNTHLNPGGTLCIYGPFNYNGEYTSPSNAEFDLWLKERDINSGIRSFEQIIALALSAGLSFDKDHAMPANNRLLVFNKVP